MAQNFLLRLGDIACVLKQLCGDVADGFSRAIVGGLGQISKATATRYPCRLSSRHLFSIFPSSPPLVYILIEE